MSYSLAIACPQGKLTKVQKYGKPSYRENFDKDERIDVAILILQSPVRVKSSSGSSINNESLASISFVQVILAAEMAKS
jgi:hypothetical protein